MIGLKCELCGHEEKYNLKYHLEECHKISAKSYRKQYPKSRTMTGHSKRTLEYWVYRGYSLEEAKNAVNIQASVYVEPYIADMLVGSNLIVEYYGDYWRRNPKYYQAADLVGEHTAEQIWEKDRKRLEYLQSKGYVTYVIWEHDWRTRRESIKTELKKLYESTNSYKTD